MDGWDDSESKLRQMRWEGESIFMYSFVLLANRDVIVGEARVQERTRVSMSRGGAPNLKNNLARFAWGWPVRIST